MNTSDAASLFMEIRRQRLLSRDTVDLYKWALCKLAEELQCTLPTRREEIQSIFDREAGLSWASQRTIWDRLRIFWAWLNGEGLCDSNPVLDMPAALKRRRLPRVLMDDELRRMLAVATNERDHAMVITLLDTGLRVGEQDSLTRAGCQQAVERVMEQAGLLPPKLGPHTLRHTFGVHYMVAGGDAVSLRRILGHSKIETTMLNAEVPNQVVSEQH